MPVPLAVPVALGGLSLLSGITGAESQRKAQIAGAESALDTQRLGQGFAEDLLGSSIGRQQPFIQAGLDALPLAELAAVGQGGFRDTPIFRQREETGLAALMEAIQGGELSGFAGERFATGLEASEEAQNRARLNDLLNIGLGASGAAGQAGGTLADLATRSAVAGADISAGGAQTSFEQRQNAINQALEGLSGIPSFIAATRQPAAPPAVQLRSI
jgi:hypothetical protein